MPSWRLGKSREARLNLAGPGSKTSRCRRRGRITIFAPKVHHDNSPAPPWVGKSSRRGSLKGCAKFRLPIDPRIPDVTLRLVGRLRIREVGGGARVNEVEDDSAHRLSRCHQCRHVRGQRGAYREAFQASSFLFAFSPRAVPWAIIAMRLRCEDISPSSGDQDSRRRRRPRFEAGRRPQRTWEPPSRGESAGLASRPDSADAEFAGLNRGRDAGCPAPPAQIRT